MQQYLRMMKRHERIALVAQPNAYEFRKDRGWHWVQRACFFLLKKIGAHQMMSVTTVEYGPLQGSQKLMDAVFKAVDHAVGWERYDPDKLVIVMGRKEFMELVCDRDISQAMGWTLDMDICTRTPYARRIIGVPIAEVPWMEGFAVVPSSLLKSGAARAA